MRPKQKNCGDKTRRWKGGGGDMQSIKAQQRLGILQSMQNTWIPNFPCHEKMSGRWTNPRIFYFFLFGWTLASKNRSSTPQEFMTFWRSEAKRPKAVQVRRFWNNTNNEILPMICCVFTRYIFLLQKHWIYSQWCLFLWFGQFIEMSPYRKALVFLWGANPKAGSGSLHQGAIDPSLTVKCIAGGYLFLGV